MANPEFVVLKDGAAVEHPMLPVYRTTRQLPASSLRDIIAKLLGRFGATLPNWIPPDIQHRHELLSAPDAVRRMHYPKSAEDRALARRSIAFIELLAVQLCIIKRKRLREHDMSGAPLGDGAAARAFIEALPFRLTDAQARATGTILADLQQPRPMGRLLQGDVGSGKTVVALAAMLEAVAAGKQAVLMAPTEVLAVQHYRTLSALLGFGGQAIEGAARLDYEPHSVEIVLVTGSMRAKERRSRLRAIADGTAQIIVGTHALIQGEVEYDDLALAIVDEQHRFGVMQRAALRDEGSGADGVHLLVMTATPIPRSLALTLYGDLDISVIDELPPGRQEIATRWLQPGDRSPAFEAVRDEVAAGRQAFVICPLVDGSSAVESRSATEEYERLRREEFAEFADRVALLHGRMKSGEKEAVMQRFASGEVAVLVSTAVVEVGIDVPAATVIVIEGAGRFGIAQLHQFRGRVGRGEHPSRCFLLDDDPTPEAEERLSLVERNSSGFELAQADLELRGPGELFGVEQAGSGLHAASLLDPMLIEATRIEAESLLDSDPELGFPDHAGLRQLANQAARDIISEAH